MKTTYTRTVFIKDLSKATIRIYMTEGIKWFKGAGKRIKVEYTGVTAWDIIEGGKEAEEIEAMTDANSIDENHEYLVLHFENGETATFRQSHVDMFII